MEMPTPCPECGEIVEFNDMVDHPNYEDHLVCTGCCDRVEEENNNGSDTDGYGNTLSWKADPDCGLIEIFVNGEEVVSWSYEDEADGVFSEFLKVWKMAQAATGTAA